MRQLETDSTLLLNKSRTPDQSETLDPLSKDGAKPLRLQNFRDMTTNSGTHLREEDLLPSGKMLVQLFRSMFMKHHKVFILTTMVSMTLLMNLRMLANSITSLMELIGIVDTKEGGQLLLLTTKLHLLEEELRPSNTPNRDKDSVRLFATSEMPLKEMSKLLISHQNGKSLITCSELMSTTQKKLNKMPTVLLAHGIELRTPDQ